MTEPTPRPRPRPALDRWLRDHDMDYQDAARRLGSTRQFIRDICLPFDDPKRKHPGPQLVVRIIQVTNGAIRPQDFYPPVEQILRQDAPERRSAA